MASVPVANTILAELIMGLGGELIENTLYFEMPTAPTVPDLEALGVILRDWWGANVAPELSNAVSLIRIELTDLTGPTGPAVSFTAGLPDPGLNVGEPAASNVAPAISFRTGSRGRSFRGRNFISGIPEAGISGNIVAGVVLDNLTDAYNQLAVDTLAGGFTWVVVSRFSGVDPVTHDPIPRVAGVTTPILSAEFTDNVVDSQRRRLPNH